MAEKVSAAQKMESVWKSLVLIGVILVVGFNAAMFTVGFQTKAGADTAHAKIEAAEDANHKKVEVRLDEHQESLTEQRYIQVRIEVGQKQIHDQLDGIASQNRMAMAPNSAERRVHRKAVEASAKSVAVRREALEKSYRKTPVIPRKVRNGGGKVRPPIVDSDDPLAGLDGI